MEGDVRALRLVPHVRLTRFFIPVVGVSCPGSSKIAPRDLHVRVPRMFPSSGVQKAGISQGVVACFEILAGTERKPGVASHKANGNPMWLFA